MRAFTPKGWRRPILTSDNPRLKDWRSVVAMTAGSVATGEMFTGPVSVSLVFHVPRPKSAPRSVVYPAKKPDLDKLVRACLDALTHVLWVDDSQVIDLLVKKRYAVGEPVGVFVSVADVGPEFVNAAEDR
jgi:crossover junction endodeoxyribonuclease RusA